MPRLMPVLLCLALNVRAHAQSPDTDRLLAAMRDELSRSRGLKVPNLETPYYVEYRIEDGESFAASAILGGLISVNHSRFRIPAIKVRVGDYKFDNTNYVGSGFHFGSRYDIDPFPLENVYPVLRRYLWLATDSAYKSAVESISRKRAALKNVAVNEQIDDYAKAEPLRRLIDIRRASFDENAWIARVRALSRLFAAYPQLKTSSIEFYAVQSAHYLVTSEGTDVRFPENLMFLRARATSQGPDGMVLRDAAVFHSRDFYRIPLEAELQHGVTAVAENVRALARAPRGEIYNGPVLFEGVAAAQLFAEVLGKNLILTRRPVTEPGRPGVFAASELEGRLGTRVLPEWMDVVDDPTQKEWRGRPLFGSYEVDREGVIPRPLLLVEKGVLKGFLLTRQPVRGFAGSNGRARLPGSFGANTAGFSNLFVRASATVSRSELKKKMLELSKARHKPYGLIVRKMDFPSSASLEEIRRLLSGSAHASGSRPVSIPILVYRIYPDGKEELVRGLRFRRLDTRSLKDIVAAGDDHNEFEFLDSSAPFALMGVASHTAETCAIAPSVLIDELELGPAEDELPKLPIVPPPLAGAP